jgi:hypothetical protein
LSCHSGRQPKHSQSNHLSHHHSHHLHWRLQDTNAIELSAIAAGTGGFVINGESEGDWSGYSVSNAGDVNGDGVDDLIVGAYRADPSGKISAGKSYVVFGKQGNTNAIDPLTRL